MSDGAHQLGVDTQQADVTACMIRGRAGSRWKERCVIFTKLCQPLKSLIDYVSARISPQAFCVLWLNNYLLTCGSNVHMYKVAFFCYLPSPFLLLLLVFFKKKGKGLVRVKVFLHVCVVQKDVLHHWGLSQGQLSLRARADWRPPSACLWMMKAFTRPCQQSSDLLFKKKTKNTWLCESLYFSQIWI